MKRRRVLLSVGGALIGSSATISSQNPAVGLDFSISEVSSAEPSQVDSIIVQFDQFLLTPRYIDESSNPASINVQVKLDDSSRTTRSEEIEIPIQNGEVTDVAESGVGNIRVPVNTDKNFLEAQVSISVSIGGFQETYQQSFIVRDRVPDTEGGTTSIINPDGNQYRLHAFKSDGEFNVKSDDELNVDLLVVGGGGGGAGNRGGGGGAGELIYKQNYTVSGRTTVKVGSGGSGGSNADGSNGEKSEFGSLVADGGGGGGAQDNPGKDGGSGGGGGCRENPGGVSTADIGIGSKGGRGPVNTGQTGSAGGGGGATTEGLEPNTSSNEYDQLGHGGRGKDLSSVFGTNYGFNGKFAGGGGGGTEGHCNSFDSSDVESDRALGRAGGGDSGPITGGGTCGNRSYNQLGGEDAQPNTGSGGGGGNFSDNIVVSGGNGGSGIVLVRIGPI